MEKKIIMLTTAHRHDDVRIFSKEAQALSKDGWKVEIINRYYCGSWKNKIEFKKVKIPQGRISRFLLSRSVMKKELVKSGTDSIIVLHDPELILMIPFLKKAGYKTVYDAHEDLLNSISGRRWIAPAFKPAVSRFAGRIINNYLPQSDAVIAVTETISKNLALNATVVRNRVTDEDCKLYDNAINKYPKLENTVCYAGSITEQRGIERMILCCHNAGAKLLLAGQYESDKLRDKIEKLPQYSCVSYMGVLSREKIAVIYAKSCAGLLLLDPIKAYMESEPIKLFEYLCAGIPVIASRFEHWEKLADNNTVLFVDVNCENSITSAIKKAIESEKLIELAQKRRFKERQKFGFGEDAVRLTELFNNL